MIQSIQGSGRLAGVIHAAGVVDDGIIMQQTAHRIGLVLAPKVLGAWNLHELTAHLQLDGFILFSSMASLAGSPGQAGYAAGNAFLDGLAKYRRGRGLPALSLNWGAWSGGGMAAKLDLEGKRQVLPWIQPMAAERCFAGMAEAWHSGVAQVAIASVDWNAWKPAPRLIAGLAATGVVAQPEHRSPTIRERLAGTPVTNQRKLVLSYLRERAAAILGLDASYTIDDRQPLIHMGLDSLMAVELRNQLASDFGRPLKATLLFDHPTLSELAQVLLGVPGNPRRGGSDAVLDELASLSEQEAEELLNQELERS